MKMLSELSSYVKKLYNKPLTTSNPDEFVEMLKKSKIGAISIYVTSNLDEGSIMVNAVAGYSENKPVLRYDRGLCENKIIPKDKMEDWEEISHENSLHCVTELRDKIKKAIPYRKIRIHMPKYYNNIF